MNRRRSKELQRGGGGASGLQYRREQQHRREAGLRRQGRSSLQCGQYSWAAHSSAVQLGRAGLGSTAGQYSWAGQSSTAGQDRAVTFLAGKRSWAGCVQDPLQGPLAPWEETSCKASCMPLGSLLHASCKPLAHLLGRPFPRGPQDPPASHSG
jgi:hypothetical protein